MAGEVVAEQEQMEEEDVEMVKLGSYGGMVRVLVQVEGDDEEDSAAAEETMLLWGIQQPTLSKPNAFVAQSSLNLSIDACGHSLSILQSPSSLGTPGVTGSVMWDSGVILGKFLEHAVDSGTLHLQGKKIVELGSGCGLVGCIAALLGGEVILTDLPDRLRLLKKNITVNLGQGNVRGSATVTEFTWGDEPDPQLIEPPPDFALLGGQVILTDLPDRLRLLKKNITVNLGQGNVRGSATVTEFTWGDEPDTQLIEPLPDFVVGSDVIYSEGAVGDLLAALEQLCGSETTIFLAGELRNDAILEYFLEAAMEDFLVGRVDQEQWHPDYCSGRVVLYVLVKK